jgi:hypothetical protein
MAGILIPTWFLVLGVTAFTIMRSVYQFSVPVERMIAFPMAAVPNLWGLWNLLYLRFELRRILPLGVWGALLPLILVPGGLALARGLDVVFLPYTDALILVPIGAGAYYLIWKHLVPFFNRVVGLS